MKLKRNGQKRRPSTFLYVAALSLAASGWAFSSKTDDGGEAVKEPVFESIGNPYLPLWEHVPDGEPRVFEDPDNPGKYRVYIIGSHDLRLDS